MARRGIDGTHTGQVRARTSWQRAQKSLSELSLPGESESLSPTGNTCSGGAMSRGMGWAARAARTGCFSHSVRGQEPKSCALYLAFMSAEQAAPR